LAGFFASEVKRMRTSGGGGSTRAQRENVAQQRPAGRATQWRVILYHRPNSEKPNRKVGFFAFCVSTIA